MKTYEFLHSLQLQAESLKILHAERFHKTQDKALLPLIGEFAYIEHAAGEFAERIEELEQLVNTAEYMDKEIAIDQIKEAIKGSGIPLIFNDTILNFLEKLPQIEYENEINEIDAIESFFNTNLEIDQFKQDFNNLLSIAQTHVSN